MNSTDTVLRLGPLVLCAALTLVSSLGCGNHIDIDEDQHPQWVVELIEGLEAQDVRNPPASVTRYDLHGEHVYYVPPYCCDMFSVLYDSTGTPICAPDGGFTGGGDGGCPGFYADRTNELVIWQDGRK